jgi:hypothetical protein
MSMKPVRAALAVLAGLACVAVGGLPAATAATDDPPIGVTIIAPLIAPAGDTGLVSAEALAQYTSPLGLLTRELDALADRPVAIGIDPMIIASIRVLGSTAPPSAIAWLERLERATNQVFPLAYADADPTLEFEAGAASPLAPQAFDFAIDATLFAAAQTPGPTGSPTPTPTTTPDAGPPPLPTTEDILAWNYTPEAIAWPAEGTVSTASLDWLTAAGVESTIVSSGNVAVSDPRGNANATAGKNAVLVSDDAVSALLREAAATSTSEAWTEAVSRLSTAIAGAQAAGAGQARSIVITLGRDIPHTGSRVADTIDAVSRLSTVSMTSLSQAFAKAPSTVTITDGGHPAETVQAARPVIAAETAEAGFATILDNPEQLTAERRLRALALFSREWSVNPDGWHTGVATFQEQSSELLSSVQVADISTINLLTNLKPLPISVNNDLPYPVTVYITVKPRTGLLKVENTHVKLTIEPDSQGKGEIPVQAITNGTVVLDVSLASPAGVAIGEPAQVEINVQASWETPITVALAAIVVFFFGFGIVRTVLRRRKAARE